MREQYFDEYHLSQVKHKYNDIIDGTTKEEQE